MENWFKSGKRGSAKSTPSRQQSNVPFWQQTNVQPQHQHQHQHHQTQMQQQMQKQRQIVERIQLLHDDTDKLLNMTAEYLTAARNGQCNRKKLRNLNNTVNTALMLFKMKVSSMKSNGRKEGIDFSEGFAGCSAKLTQFEATVKGWNCGGPQGERAVMERLNPILDYATRVLFGGKVPDLPYIEPQEEEEMMSEAGASEVFTQYYHTVNHVLPERMNEISQDKDAYMLKQQKLSKNFRANPKPAARTQGDLVYNKFIHDYNGEMAFPLSAKQQRQFIAQQQQSAKFKKPDLCQVEYGDDGDWKEPEAPKRRKRTSKKKKSSY